jgi:hypothetical protein
VQRGSPTLSKLSPHHFQTEALLLVRNKFNVRFVIIVRRAFDYAPAGLVLEPCSSSQALEFTYEFDEIFR